MNFVYIPEIKRYIISAHAIAVTHKQNKLRSDESTPYHMVDTRSAEQTKI